MQTYFILQVEGTESRRIGEKDVTLTITVDLLLIEVNESDHTLKLVVSPPS